MSRHIKSCKPQIQQNSQWFTKWNLMLVKQLRRISLSIIWDAYKQQPKCVLTLTCFIIIVAGGTTGIRTKITDSTLWKYFVNCQLNKVCLRAYLLLTVTKLLRKYFVYDYWRHRWSCNISFIVKALVSLFSALYFSAQKWRNHINARQLLCNYLVKIVLTKDQQTAFI